MITKEVRINYPAGFEFAVQMTKKELERHIRLMAALKMFELGEVSAGKASELAGMSRREFLEACGKYHISIFNYSSEKIEEELTKDWETLKNISQ